MPFINNYKLIWSTQSTKFFRSRLVVTSLVKIFLHASIFSQKSLHDFNKFICLFSEIISLLDAIDIPDMDSFILFSVAFRCLTLVTHKQIESATCADQLELKHTRWTTPVTGFWCSDHKHPVPRWMHSTVALFKLTYFMDAGLGHPLQMISLIIRYPRTLRIDLRISR